MLVHLTKTCIHYLHHRNYTMIPHISFKHLISKLNLFTDLGMCDAEIILSHFSHEKILFLDTLFESNKEINCFNEENYEMDYQNLENMNDCITSTISNFLNSSHCIEHPKGMIILMLT